MTMPFLESVDVPRDEAPPTDTTSGDYDPEFPGSTPSAPFGFKPDGTPYKRRPNGAGPGGGGKKSGGKKSSGYGDRSAQTAASLLARMNGLVGISLMAFGMPATASSLAESNDQFETMAYEALRSDPELCRKILAAGATSGKAGLIMAYGMLGVSIAPAAVSEIKAKRAERNEDDDATAEYA